MVRKLHLHIGLRKTGTTYLQRGLLANRERLAVHGFAFGPATNKSGANHDLAFLMREKGGAALADTLIAAPGERMIVSAEAFGLRFYDHTETLRLAEALRGAFRTTVYLWLRRQDFLRESNFSQDVKCKPARSIEDDDGFPYDFSPLLASLDAAFGGDALRVRIYRDDVRTDVLHDFLGLLGIPDHEIVTIAPQNTAIGRRGTLYLAGLDFPRDVVIRRAGYLHDRDVDPRWRRVKEHIFQAVAAGGSIAEDGGRFLSPPAARRSLMERYAASNAALCERYGLSAGDRDWMIALPPDDPDWFPAAPITRAERRAAWAAALTAIRPRHKLIFAARISRMAAAV